MKNYYSLLNILITLKTLLSFRFKNENNLQQTAVVIYETNSDFSILNSKFLIQNFRALAFSLFAIFSIVGGAKAQITYTLSTGTTGSLNRDMYGGVINWAGATTFATGYYDDSGGGPYSLGFNFMLQNATWSSFNVSTNGVVHLKSTYDGTITTQYSLPWGSNSAIGAFINDFNMGANGTIKYIVSGSAPYRYVAIQWENIGIPYTSTTTANGTGVTQVRLYETTNIIEFVYGNMSTQTGTPTNYYVGFSTNTNSPNVVTVNTSTHALTQSATATANTYSASSTVTNLHSTSEGSRRFYRLQPSGTLAISTGTTPGNYTWQSYACNPTIELWGGGGGGGGAGGFPGGGGGGAGGSYIKTTAPGLTLGTNYQMTAGAAGTAGVAAGTSAGGSGGNSYFGNTTAGNSTGATRLAVGGNGGAGNTTNSASSAGGAKKTTGNVGGTAVSTYGGAGGTGATGATAGGGGGGAGTAIDGNPGSAGSASGGTAAVAGGGTGGNAGNGATAAVAGGAPGGGGGGARATTTTDRAGALGGVGRIIITATYATSSAAPTVSSLCSGSTSISGTSSEANGTTIEVFKNGVSAGTTTVSSSAWTLSGLSALVAGDSYTANATASCKFKSSTSATVVVLQAGIAPTGTAATVTAACPSFSTTLTQTGGTIGASGTWYWYSSSCGGTLLGTSTSANATYTTSVSESTTYYVRSQGSCIGNTNCQSIAITAYSVPTATWSRTPSNAQFTGTELSFTTSPSGGTSPYTYSWSTSEAASGISASPSSGTSSSFTSTITNSNAYNSVVPSPAITYSMTVTDANSCSVTASTISPTIYPVIRAPQGSTSRCQGSATETYTSATSAPLEPSTGLQGYTGFVWSLSPGTAGSINSSTGAVTWDASFSGTATVSVYARNANSTAGNGTQPSATQSTTVTVAANNSITLSSTAGTDNQNKCVSSALTTITYATTGATGATVTGLPAGVTPAFSGNSTSGTVTISGTPSESGTFNYTVTMTGGCTGGTNTATGVLVIDPAVVGGNISPASTSVCTGTNSTALTLSGHTGSITKWQSSTASDFSANLSDIVNTSTSYTATDLSTTKYYRAVLSSGQCVSANSATATVTVNPLSVGGTISGGTTVCTGTNSTNLTLSGHTGSVTKWQSSSASDFSTALTDISNTTASLTATNLTTTMYYRAVVTSGVCSSANSSSATISVDAASAGGSISPASTSVCTGTNSTVLTLSGYTGSITKWQSSAASNFSSSDDITNTTNSLTAVNLTSTIYYRAVVTSGACSAANSTSALITVDPAAAGGTISGGTSVCTGTNSTLLTLSGNTGSVTKWQSSTNSGSSWSDIVNTNSTYTATNLTATTLYRAVITSGSCSTTANSSSATVTVNALPQGSLTGNGTICPNGTASLTWTASSGTGPFTVVYNNGASNVTQNSVVSGTSFTANASLSSTTSYTLVSVTDANGCERTSSFTGSSATITVRSVPTTGDIQSPATATICGSTEAVYGQVYGSGITEGAGATSNLTADLGYNSTNTNPNTWTNWMPATFDTQSGNNDQFVAQLGSGLSTGTWYYAYRYSYYGCDYLYGGTSGIWSNNSGVATVPTSQSITLSSSAGTNAQSFCKGTSLTNITYTLGSGANAATVSGLPSGLSYSVSGTTLTISGTPNGSGNSTYIITTSGTSNCPVIATGTITVNETLDLVKLQSPASATICPSATLDVYGQVYESGLTESAGAGAGITVQAGYSTTNNNPSNWTNWFSASFDTQSGNNDQYTYNFSGLSAGTYYYAFKYSYNGCVAYGGYNSGAWDGSTNVSGTLTVTSNNTTGTASSSPTLCINEALTNITHSTTGATGIGTASGLPEGVSASWASNTITISGTPTEAGSFTYSIPLSGGCGSVNATGTIIVNPSNTVSSASSSPTLCINTAMTSITHTTTGCTGIANSGISGANGLPTGVSASWAVNNILTISGTPTVSGTYNYSIALTGGCGSVTATGTITVSPANTAGVASSSPTLCINTALTNITHSTTGTTGISNSGVSGSNGLPAGVSASWSSNVITISGTPTASGTFNYYIPMTGGCSSVNATGTIVVNSVSIGGSISGGTSVCTGTNSTILTLSGYTGSITKWQSSTTSDFSSSVTDITNTSTTNTATNLTSTTYFRAVVTNGSCSAANSSSATITVNSASVGGSVAGSTTVCTGTNSSVLTLSGYTGSITKWQSSTVSDFSSSVVDISNSTTTNTATNLTTTTYYRAVITNGVCSATYSSIATVTVNPTSVGGTVTGGATVCTGTNSTLLTLSGNTGTVTKWQSSSVSDFSSAVSDIVNTASTYTATNLSATTYFRAVVASGVCTSSNSVSTTITVSSISVGGSVSPSTNSICSGNNQALVLSAYTGNVTKWQSSTSSDFTTGVSDIVSTNANYTATNITTPTYFRAVVTNGACSSANSTSSTISLTPNNTITLSSANGTDVQSLCINTAITGISYTTTGATGANITGLPTGVSGSWSDNSVTISGTPIISGTFSYTVTMTGNCTGGTNTASGTITVNPLSVGGSVTGSGTVCSSTNSTTLTLVGNTGSITKWQSSLNNSLWNDIPGTAGSSTYTATDISSTTYYKALITSGSCSSTNSSTATITYGTSTKYWAGKGSTIPGFCTTCTDFNNATHWSSSNTSVVGTSAPSACDNIVINTNAVVVIGVSANTTVNSLSITSSAAAMVNINLAANVTATINTTTTLTNNQSGANYLILSANNGSSWIFNGDFTAAGSATGTTYTVPFCGYTTVLAATTGTYTFKGNATFGAQCTQYTTNLTNGVIFDGSSAQTITWNNANAWQLSGSAAGGVTVGSSNTANVTFAGSGAGAVTSGNNLTIGANSTLDLASRTLNRTASGGGTLLLNSGSILKIGSTNTFPANYTTNTLNGTSTVQYNGAAQTVSAQSYGHLILSGSATKTITGLASIAGDFTTSGTAATGAASTGITIGGNVTLGSGTTFNAGTSLTHNVAGNWTNNGATYSFTTGNTVNFNGSSNKTIGGTSNTAFNAITVNTGSSISTVLEVTGPITSTGNLTITNGLLKLTHASAAPSHGTCSIASTGGLEINGGTLNSSAGSVTNNGLFRLISGTANVGSSAGNALSNPTGATCDIQGGTLNVSGRIYTTAGTYNQSGGTVTVCTVGNTSSTIANFHVGSGDLNISAGSLIIRLPNTAGTPYNSLYIGSSGTKTITGGTIQIGDASTTANQTFLLSSAISLYNLTVNAANSPIAKLNDNVTISNNFTLSGGTYDANGFTSTIPNLVTVPTGASYLANTATQSLNGGLTVSGGTFTGAAGTVTTTNVSLSSGTLTAPSGTFNVSGNWTKSGGTFTHNSGTVVLNGTNQTLSGSTDFYSFNKTVTSGATLTFPASASQTFAVGGTLTLQGAANNLLKIVSSTPGTQATINPSGTRVIDYVDAKDNNNTNGTAITATNSYDAGNLTNWEFSAANMVWRGSTNTNWNTVTNWASGYLPNATDNVTITKTGANELVLETSPTVNNITISANNTVSLGSNTLTVKGTWLNNGTLTPGTSTVVFAGASGTQTVNNGANSFNNVTHTGASTLQALTNALNFGGTFNNSAGTFDANSLGNTFTGAVTLSGGTFTAGSSSQTFDGAVTLSGGTFTAGSSSQTFDGGLTVSGGTFTGSTGAVTTTNLSISSGTFTAPSTTLSISGDFSNSGTFTHNSGSVVFNGTTQSITGATTFNNLTHSGASAQTLTINAATTANGNVINSAGTLALNNVNLTIGGNYSNSVVSSGFTPGSGSVFFNKASGIQTLLMTTGGDFSNLQHTGAGTLQLLSDLTLSGSLTNSAGTFDVNGFNIVIGGNWTNSATFLPGTGSTYVALNGSSGTQTVDHGSSQFNDLQVIGTAEISMTAPAQSFGNVSVNGPLSTTAQLVLTGGDSQSITSTYYTGGTPIPFQNLTVNKTAGAVVTLTKPVRVTGTLTMTQGDIITDATNILEVGSSASSVGSVSWAAGTVRGPMKRWFATSANGTPESGIFPIGADLGGSKGVTNRYTQINFTSAPGAGGYIIAKYFAQTPSLALTEPIWTSTQYIQNYEEEGYWDITPYDASGQAYQAMNSTPYTLKLRLNNPSTLLPGVPPAGTNGNEIPEITRVRIISAKGPDHNSWVVAGNQGSNQTILSSGDYLLEELGVTGFSWFNGGGDNYNPLPVELVSFSGVCLDGAVNLTWKTASEQNSSHFDIEKSNDGTIWRLISTVPSAENSTELLTYNIEDISVGNILNYYRLRQVDKDGNQKLYDPIFVSCNENENLFKTLPNPSDVSFQVLVNNKSLIGKATIKMIDTKGTVVSIKEVQVEEGTNLFYLNENMSPGIYYISVSNGNVSTEVIKHSVR